jgi:hypothetical protein
MFVVFETDGPCNQETRATDHWFVIVCCSKCGYVCLCSCGLPSLELLCNGPGLCFKSGLVPVHPGFLVTLEFVHTSEMVYTVLQLAR